MTLGAKLFRRWDSSDPDRAPPPLPCPPNTHTTSPVRPNASAHIAAAAEALAAKARENAGPSPYTINPMPERSPERSLIKGAAHRRLQSLQNNTVRDIRAMLDRTPERSPERQPSTPSTSRTGRSTERFGSPEPSTSRETTPTPASRDLLRETPGRRNGSRPPPKAILGENTPPSATLLAIKNMDLRDLPDTPTPLSTVSINANANASATGTASRHRSQPQSFDAISSQILSLTTIATSLQQEMQHLSQRSKDNASDLNKLKDATHARDEDIRNSLKELLNNVSTISTTASTATAGASRPNSGLFGSVSTPPHNTAGVGSSPTKAFTLPRISSPVPFFDESLRLGSASPNPYSVEGAASVAMLEKIIREMVTKDGQERLLGTLSQLFDKASKESGQTAQKVAELVEFIKDSPSSQALVSLNGSTVSRSTSSSTVSSNGKRGSLTLASRELGVVEPQTKAEANGAPKEQNHMGVDDDGLPSILNKIKESVFHSGGLISEVKAQQRDLRGEVLHMGRSLAEKIDQARKPAGNSKAIEDGSGKQDVARIVQEGLGELRSYLEGVMRERGRNWSAESDSGVSGMYEVVRHRPDIAREVSVSNSPPLDKEAILDAVKEAYEAFRPEIELQQFGLERDEILECLKEGLEGYRTSAPDALAMREEISSAVHEAMQTYGPVESARSARSISDGGIGVAATQEILSAVRQCLDEVRSQQPGSRDLGKDRDRELDVTREVVLDAVKAALISHGPTAPREIEINAEDLYRALVKALQLSDTRNPLHQMLAQHTMGTVGSINEEMNKQFAQYSAAHGRDTEQVLDFMKDGLEAGLDGLKREIEAYVDRAQDVTGKDEIVDEIRGGVAHVRDVLEGAIKQGPEGDARFSTEWLKAQFDGLYAALRELDSNRGDLDGLTKMQETVMTRQAGHKNELLDVMQNGFDTMLAKLPAGSLADVKEEMEHMRNTFSASVVQARSAGANDGKDELLDEIRLSLDDLRRQLVGPEHEPSFTLLAAIQSEFNQLRIHVTSSGSNSLTPSVGGDLEALHEAVNRIKEAASTSPTEQLNVLHMDLVKLSAQIRDSSKADTDEILDAVRIGLDDLRSHLEKKLDNPERQMAAHGEILDTINDGIESLKTEFSTSKEPMDQTVLYEILDTLKDGIKTLKADFESLKITRVRANTGPKDRSLTTTGGEVVLADDGTEAAGSITGAVQQEALQKMEVMLAQLQVKVDAVNANISDIPSHAPSQVGSERPHPKTDLSSIEELLKDMQASVDLVASRALETEALAKKEDTDAIETLLRNTKAKLDELPDQGPGAMNSQLDSISEKIQAIIADFSEEMKEQSATKKDIFTVEALILDLKSAVDELKDSQKSTKHELDEVTKTDLDALKLVALEIKEKVLEMQVRDVDSPPARHDLDHIKALIHEFRDSHDKLKESYECDIGITAKAFDDRKAEAADILLMVRDLRDFVQDVKDEMSGKMTATGLDVARLSENVNGMEQTISQNFSIAPVITELVDTVNREFERVGGMFNDLRREQDDHATTGEKKHEDVREAIVLDIYSKIDERHDSLVNKYDEARIDALAQAAEQEKILASTKEMSEELRVSIDTLGMTVTGIEATFKDMADRMVSDSQASLGKLEDGFGRITDMETRPAAADEHRRTRDSVSQVAIAIDTLQTDVSEYHPKLLVILQEVLSRVNEQHGNIQMAKEEAQERDRVATEHTRALTEELKTSVLNLPALLPPPPSAAPEPVTQYDDAQLHEKLDRLLCMIQQPAPLVVPLEKLDIIHNQVLATASEISNFVSTQTKLITEDAETAQKESEELARLLERQRADKEHLEAAVAALRTEKATLANDVEGLHAQRQELADQKAALSRDVGALSTALEVRHEELRSMHEKADALERRVREVVLQHAGSHLRAANALNASDVPFNNGNASQRTVSGATNTSSLGPLPRSAPGVGGLAIALKNRGVRRGPPTAMNPGQARRILSLNTISHNVPTGALGYAAQQDKSALVKRSHSVRSQTGGRKTSWGKEPKRLSGATLPKIGMEQEEGNKENAGGEMVLLGDIVDERESESEDEDGESTGTVTHTEMTGHETETESFVSDTDRRESARSDMSFETGSYLTGSDVSRRSSEHGTFAGESEFSHESEESHEDGEGHEDEDDMSVVDRSMIVSQVSGSELSAEQSEGEGTTPRPTDKHSMALYDGELHSDSGIGTETKLSEAGYFRRALEDAASSVAGS